MIQIFHSFIAAVWILSLPHVFARDIAASASSVCQTCSTTATFWVLSQPVKTYSEISTITLETRSITRGTKTQTRLDLTTTKIVYTRSTGEGPDLRETVFNRRTTTIQIPSATATTICPPTSTPSDYPASTLLYCQCKKTSSITRTTTGVASVFSTTTTYLTTQTVQPTVYGETVLSTETAYINAPVLVQNVKFTKTVYQSTSTVTLPSNPTGTDISTFKLQLVNCGGCYTEGMFAQVDYDASDYLEPLNAHYPNSAASVFEIVGGMLRLHDLNDPRDITCGFVNYDYDEYNAATLNCGSKAEDVATLLSGHLTIDCFGYLRGYLGNATTWGYATNPYAYLNGLSLYPPGDPVHEFGRRIPGDAFGYHNLRAVPYAL